MTYQELLEITHQRKLKAIREINDALNGPMGFLIKDELERNPGSIAYLYLAKDFCEALYDHLGEFIDQAGGIDSWEAREIGSIYMAYENSDPDLYSMLPVEAQLFEREG